MIKTEYLITLLELYNHRTSRVWEEINNNDLSFEKDTDFLSYLDTLIKDKRKRSYFDQTDIRKAIFNTKKIIDYCDKTENLISIISFEDSKYPAEKMSLLFPNERPILLYAKGEAKLLLMDGIAIIGSRKTDLPYYELGIELGKKLANKYVIISGLAIGSDTAAHKGALLTKGKTIAILANGLHTIYPKENKQLAEDIFKSGGLLISEYPPFSTTQKHFFAQRDRLQAALSNAVIVVETGIKGGTLITINFAKIYKKKILVLEPLDDQNEYNDLGNKSLMNDKSVNVIPHEKIDVVYIEGLLNLNIKEELKFKIIKGPNFNTYLFEEKTFTKIPKDFKEIRRDDEFVFVEKTKL